MQIFCILRSFDPHLIAQAPRPWLTRRAGECAFPVDGEDHAVRSYCNPSGEATYCRTHRAAMRGPPLSSPERFARSVLTWLDRAQ